MLSDRQRGPPNEFSRDATAKKNCAVEDGKCLEDEQLPHYRLEIRFDPGGVHSLDVEAQYSYEVAATCPTEEAAQAMILRRQLLFKGRLHANGR